jgi:hypothetical protein
MNKIVVSIVMAAILLLATEVVFAQGSYNYDGGAVSKSGYVESFRSWSNDLDNLIITYQGVKASMQITNPPPSQEVLDTWNELLDKREKALDNLGQEVERLNNEYGSKDIPTSEFPWIKEFANRVSGLAGQYPEGVEYVKPAVDDMRIIINNRILYSNEPSFKAEWTDELSVFNNVVSNSGL